MKPKESVCSDKSGQIIWMDNDVVLQAGVPDSLSQHERT